VTTNDAPDLDETTHQPTGFRILTPPMAAAVWAIIRRSDAL